MTARRYRILLALNLATAAHCMVAQMALSVTLAFVAGESVAVMAVFLGLYLAAMGGGVLLVERSRATAHHWLRRLLGLVALAALAASPGVPAVMVAHEVGPAPVVWSLGLGLSLVLGGVSGATLPIVSKIAEAEGWPAAPPLIAALTSDFMGATLGCLAFGLVLFPELGPLHAVVLSAAFAVLALNLAAVAFGSARRQPALVLTVLLLLDAWVATALSQREELIAFLDRVPL